MKTLLTIFISIWKFVWRRLGAAGILFIILLFAVPISLSLYEDNADDYVYESQYEIGQTSISHKSVSLISKSEAIVAQFSEYELDESYGKKYIYQVNVDVTNVGVNPICIGREFNGFYVENENGNMESFKVYDYYYEMDQYDRFDTEVIASARTGSVRFLFVFDEDDVPSKLTFYDSYEGEKLFELEVPSPRD